MVVGIKDGKIPKHLVKADCSRAAARVETVHAWRSHVACRAVCRYGRMRVETHGKGDPTG